jgi:hypothetical protein
LAGNLLGCGCSEGNLAALFATLLHRDRLSWLRPCMDDLALGDEEVSIDAALAFPSLQHKTTGAGHGAQ